MLANLWCKVILYYQFFSIDVGVSASSQLRCEMDITTHGGSHVPFTGDRAPIEAATFPSRGQGTHRGSHVPFTGDRVPIEAATFPSRGQGAHRNSHVPFTGTGRP